MTTQSGKSFRSYVSLSICSSTPSLLSQPTDLPLHQQQTAHAKTSDNSFLGIPPSKPNTKDSVLVIVDAQNEYDHGLLAISDLPSSRTVIKNVLGKWREAEGNVVSNPTDQSWQPNKNKKKKRTRTESTVPYKVHVLHDTPDGAPLFTPNTELADEFPELTPSGASVSGNEKVIHKQHPSAFTGTDLAAHLDALGKKEIVLAGNHAHHPIPSTQQLHF